MQLLLPNTEKNGSNCSRTTLQKITLISFFLFFFPSINRKGSLISSMDVTMIKVSLIEFASWLISFQENTASPAVQVMVFGVSSKATGKKKYGSGHPKPKGFFCFSAKMKAKIFWLAQNYFIELNT